METQFRNTTDQIQNSIQKHISFRSGIGKGRDPASPSGISLTRNGPAGLFALMKGCICRHSMYVQPCLLGQIMPPGPFPVGKVAQWREKSFPLPWPQSDSDLCNTSELNFYRELTDVVWLQVLVVIVW